MTIPEFLAILTIAAIIATCALIHHWFMIVLARAHKHLTHTEVHIMEYLESIDQNLEAAVRVIFKHYPGPFDRFRLYIYPLATYCNGDLINSPHVIRDAVFVPDPGNGVWDLPSPTNPLRAILRRKGKFKFMNIQMKVDSPGYHIVLVAEDKFGNAGAVLAGPVAITNDPTLVAVANVSTDGLEFDVTPTADGKVGSTPITLAAVNVDGVSFTGEIDVTTLPGDAVTFVINAAPIGGGTPPQPAPQP